LLLVVVAVPALRSANRDVYPEFKRTVVEVQAEALGLSAVEVEQLVTVPLEQDLLNGVPFVERITSRTIPGHASVEMLFEEGTDLYRARQLVTERMAQAHALPGVGTPPAMVQPRSSINRVAVVALKSEDVSLIEMSILARWQLKPRLLGIPGVSNVSVWGQRDRQLQVQVDPERLKSSGITLTRLIETTGNALWVSPLSFVEASTPGTGGFVETPGQRLGVQHVSPITTADALAAVAVAGTTPAKRIGDVADVVEDHQPLIGDASLDAAQSLVVMVDRFPDADPANVAADVEAALEALAPGMTGITVATDVYRPDAFLSDAIRRIGVLAVIGLALMVGGVALLAGLRAALVALVTVPISVLAALYVLHLGGTSLTSMTLLGLITALALVVDDALGDVHRARLRAGGSDGTPSPQAPPSVRDVAQSVVTGRSGVLLVTAVVLVPAVPFLLLDGVPGAFTRSAAFAYVLAVLASLLVALTLTPVLAVALRVGAARPRPIDAWLARGTDLAARAAAHTGTVLVAALVLLAGGGIALAVADPDGWLPPVADQTVVVRLETAAGTALPEMSRITGRVASEVRGAEGVDRVVTTIGRALTSDRVVDVNSAEVWVALDPDADAVAARATVTDIVHGYPGVKAEVDSYATDRIEEATAPRAEGDLVVRVFGNDYGVLTTTAGEVARMLSSVRGVVTPTVKSVPTQPTARIEVDLEKAKAYGLKPGDVRREAATLVSGLQVGNLYENQKIFDVVVWGAPALRQSPQALADLRIDTPSGEQVRVGDVATVSVGPEPVVVAHDGVLRHMDVVADLSSGDRDAVVAEVTQRLRAVEMPFEYRAEVVDDGRSTPFGWSVRWVAMAMLAVLAVVFLLVQAVVGSWRGAAVVLVCATAASAGALLVFPALNGPAAAAMAGALGAALITARHATAIARDLLTDSARQRADVATVLRHHGPAVIVSTAATAALLLPAAVVPGDALALLRPAAVVLLAGLAATVLVSLALLPGLLGASLRRRAEDTAEDGAVISLPNQTDDRGLIPASTSSEGN
jgi:Cu/Ag efflux pump CusA